MLCCLAGLFAVLRLFFIFLKTMTILDLICNINVKEIIVGSYTFCVWPYGCAAVSLYCCCSRAGSPISWKTVTVSEVVYVTDIKDVIFWLLPYTKTFLMQCGAVLMLFFLFHKFMLFHKFSLCPTQIAHRFFGPDELFGWGRGWEQVYHVWLVQRLAYVPNYTSQFNKNSYTCWPY